MVPLPSKPETPEPPASEELLLAREELRRLRAELEEVRQQDAVTGLPNRHRLVDRLEQALLLAQREERQVALLFLEIDGFRSITRTFGYEENDELCTQFARRVGALLRLGDTLGRLESDRFAVLLPDLRDPYEPVRVAESILETLKVPFRLGRREQRLMVSIGISQFPQDGGDAASLQLCAESALGRARQDGGGCVRMATPTLGAAFLERREMETCLDSALLKREFEVLFQPQVTAEGAILGLEALMRWQHPVLGAVPPSKFIPLAEEKNLIHPMGEWVLREACRHASAWQALCPKGLRVAVNISAIQIGFPGWIDTVARVLRETRLPPAFLELELTEGTLMRQARPGQGPLHEVRRMGVRLAIDYFGIGYSSLSYLQRFPVDTLKLDRSFVVAIDHAAPRSSSEPIVRAILDLGRSLDLDVVAVGVETEAQLTRLRDLGCPLVQGYLLAPPMKAEEVTRRLEQQQAKAFDALLAGSAPRLA